MPSTRRRGRGAATAAATLTAAALVAGLTATPSFAGPDGPRAGAAPAAGLRWVTLITGDRVGVDARGRAVTVDRAEGRGKVPVRSWTEKDRTYVVPADAERLVARGTLDRRLFDVTGLSTPGSRLAHGKGLKVIVAYEGASGPAARTGVRGDAEVQRTLPSLNADAVTVPEQDPGALWAALTRTTAGDARTTRAVAGVDRVWLDAVRTASLDKSTARIGAPEAWRAGYDGTGVTIAVLDTGVDETHADLSGKVVGAHNFSDAPDTADRNGHGTHVASTAAGTGARSGGTHRGVAPGAKVLSAKVLNDFARGTDSQILAGMDWAVAQGADVINLSLGGLDTPDLDPLEAHVNKLSREKGVLFAVAAGNSGPGAGTIESPGSADAALTVGAVDDSDRTARFSAVGPRFGDGAVKPDVTGPGVDTTAASAAGSTLARRYGENPPGYLSISGTSMAAPHAAGAAALLKQRNPDWSGARIKSVLTASAEDGGHGVFQQGTGRIAVGAALKQSVVSDTATVAFGRQQWPHTDDRPVTKEITYRNLGDREVVLELTARGLDPQGRPAPAGFFTLGADRVTVPAGGTAAVPVTADTRIGGSVDGAYTATVVATGGGQTVRTTAAVDREVESYDLTLRHTGPDGNPSSEFFSRLVQLSGVAEFSGTYAEGKATATFRLPKGSYVLDADRSTASASDWLTHPKLELTEDTTVEVDARLARPVRMSIPDGPVPMTDARRTLSVAAGPGFYSTFRLFGSFDGLRTAQLGPQRPTGVTLTESFGAQWEGGASAQYNGAAGGPVERLSTGHDTAFTAADFAKVSATAGTSVRGKKAVSTLVSGVDGIHFDSEVPFDLPGTRTHYGATAGKANRWSVRVAQLGADGREETDHTSPVRHRRPGGSHRVTLGTAVHSPLMDERAGVFRDEDVLFGTVPLFSDGRGNTGRSVHSSARSVLYRGTTEVAERAGQLDGMSGFEVGADDAEYTLTTSVRRSPSVSAVGTRIDGSWTFRSARPAAGEYTRTPLSTVRFGARVALDGTVRANRTATFPVTVQGPAAGAGAKSLTVSVSYDSGATWQDVPVTRGKVEVKNPAQGKSVALRGQVTDRQGGKASVTVYDAYLGR
ncbi:S8 family serine peptidase [Streptomyces sp. NPDC059816]|uniref:S8 family peptidase n=1 Tax=Streptomyces sp. NPDC059816 TaxID=3346960 RepID=UPI00365245E0